MSDGITLDQNQIKRLNNLIKKTPDALFNAKVLKLVALKQKNRIFTRTTGGKDTENNPFKPYNANYAKISQKLSINDVNLTDTGLMLNAMTQSTTNDSAVISFTDDRSETLAKYHDKLGAGRNKVIRKFFGMSEDDENKILDDYTEETAKRLRKLGFE